MLYFLYFFIFLACMILISTVRYSTLNIIVQKEQTSPKIQSLIVNDGENKAQQKKQEQGFEPGQGDLACSLLLEILPSNSPKWSALFGKSEDVNEDDPHGGGSGSGQEDKRRRKKKRARKKRSSGPNEEGMKEKEELVCLYPFTKSWSATQRKIKHQYDQLVKSHGSNGLTLEQVGQFISWLGEAKNELQNKSEVVRRRFTISKALLFKADRSSFDRLRQQIYKLELEQKRLEEDAFVYNWLQEQLTLSPPYKKLLQEMQKECTTDHMESTDAQFSDMSFEELLAQEKKDSFWQKNGKLKW